MKIFFCRNEIFGLEIENISQNSPSCGKKAKNDASPFAVYSQVKLSVSRTVKFEPYQKNDDRNHKNEKCILPERLGEISRQQGMYHTLRAASGTFVSGQRIGDAFGHPVCFGRVESGIDSYKKYADEDGAEYFYPPLALLCHCISRDSGK